MSARPMPDAKLLDKWERFVPFHNPEQAAEYWVRVMKHEGGVVNTGFYDFFVARMFRFWREYHPTMLYRLIHYYPHWVKKTEYEDIFGKDFPSASDFSNNLTQIARDLIRDAEEYHKAPLYPLGQPASADPWQDRVFGLATKEDGKTLEDKKPKERWPRSQEAPVSEGAGLLDEWEEGSAIEAEEA